MLIIAYQASFAYFAQEPSRAFWVNQKALKVSHFLLH
jgi:hypothetical protein